MIDLVNNLVIDLDFVIALALVIALVIAPAAAAPLDLPLTLNAPSLSLGLIRVGRGRLAHRKVPRPRFAPGGGRVDFAAPTSPVSPPRAAIFPALVMKKPLCIALFALLLALQMPGSPSAAQPERLRLATTTSTDNSGLLAELLPAFEATCGCTVDVIAVGTGQALRLASRGDVDVVMVHAPALEEAFVAEGFGVERRTFMRNDFVIVGPASDPVGVRGVTRGAEALAKLAESDATFISRGDESGTHQRERLLWKAVGLKPVGDGYLSAGQGMGAVLTLAHEKQAYTLTDRGTWLARKEGLDLEVLVEGDPAMVNPYSVMLVNPARFDWVQVGLARQLIAWLCSDDGQRRIGAYRLGGEQLFEPLLLAPSSAP